MRIGLIGKKVGMTQRFIGKTCVPVTVIDLSNCRIMSKTLLKDGRTVFEVGFGVKKESRTSRPLLGHAKKNGVEPCYISRGFMASETFAEGETLGADRFVPGQSVDISGTTIGRGFQGVMKRHNFGGLRASHGVSVSHRSHGSTGQRQDPGKVFKGKKMAGRMGGDRVTVKNLKVVAVEGPLLLVRGCVPGFEGSYLEVRDVVA